MSLTACFPIGYFHGRFQPFHLGHLDVVRIALEKCPLVAIGVSNPFRLPPVVDDNFSAVELESLVLARSSENNPWPYWARVLMIRQGLLSEGIDIERVIIIPNVSNTGLPVDEIRFPRVRATVFICPKGEHNKAAARQYRVLGWHVEEVPPQRNCLGAAMIRERIRTGLEWDNMVPSGTAEVIRLMSGVPIGEYRVSSDTGS